MVDGGGCGVGARCGAACASNNDHIILDDLRQSDNSEIIHIY